MKLSIEVEQVQLNNWALVIRCEDAPEQVAILQEGYANVGQAMQALVECLTFAPPDLTSLEERASLIDPLLDRVKDCEDAIQTLGDRTNMLETTVEGLAQPVTRAGTSLAVQRRSTLLRERGTGQRPPNPPAAPPPSIRRAIPHLRPHEMHRENVRPHEAVGGAIAGGPRMAQEIDPQSITGGDEEL